MTQDQQVMRLLSEERFEEAAIAARGRPDLGEMVGRVWSYTERLPLTELIARWPKGGETGGPKT